MTLYSQNYIAFGRAVIRENDTEFTHLFKHSHIRKAFANHSNTIQKVSVRLTTMFYQMGHSKAFAVVQRIRRELFSPRVAIA